MLSVSTFDAGQDNSMESGRAIMERQTARRAPTNMSQTPESLFCDVNLAKDLAARCRSRALLLTDKEIQCITRDLENVIQNICDYLGRITASAFGSNYTDVPIKSLLMRPYSEADMPVNVVSNKPNRRSHYESNTPRLVDFLTGMHHELHEFGDQAFNAFPEVAEYVEPLYDAFLCPLTKEVMIDPVTVESGVTYDRRAIEEHFERFADSYGPVSCPVTKMPMQSKALMSNASLKSVVAEWMMRNGAIRIRVARTALSLSTTEAMVREAIYDLNLLAKLRKNREQMHKIGVTKFLARLLDNHNIQIRCDALELLRMLVEDDEGKDIIGKTKAIARTIELLPNTTADERHAAISFLLELSKSHLLLENIGSTAGSILILTTMKISDSDDPFAAEKAGAVLKNLGKCSKNIKSMAESGYLEPLQSHLVEGPEEMQLEMVSYLSELVSEQELTIDITGRTSAVLIRMACSGNTVARKAALDVLVQLSSHRPNSKTLVEAGAVPAMVEELFIRKVDEEPLSYKAKAASVLANMVELSGTDPDTTVVNKEGHVLTSKYSIYSFVHMLKCFMPEELNLSIVRVLLALTAHAKALAVVVSVVRENHRGHAIVELMGSPVEALNVAATRLLVTLAVHMGHTIAERLCKTQGQPGRLVKSIGHAGRVTERHAAAAALLSRLPHRNVSLNLALVREGAVPAILSGMEQMRNGATRSGRHSAAYMEGLVGALVRLTATLYNPDVLKAATDYSFASVLTELLAGGYGSSEVQRLAAMGLENLSYHSIKLSRPAPPEEEPRPKKKTILRRLKDARVHSTSTKKPQAHVCPVHRGVCSPAATFCLLEAGAVEHLLGCLESDDARVVEAALGALCTLLDERVDAEKSVAALAELGAARHVLGALRRHREGADALWQKCFCMVEKLLVHGDDRCAREVTGDRMLPTALVSAFHRGRASAKEAAESILRRLHKMPNYSTTYASTEF